MKPKLYFFKLRFQSHVCPACSSFEEQIFSRAVKDPEILQAVDLEKVEFGTDSDGKRLTLSVDFPDMDVTYGPYVYLSAPYDETTGYHLHPNTMHNPEYNRRLIGELYQYRNSSDFPSFKNWILTNARILKNR